MNLFCYNVSEKSNTAETFSKELTITFPEFFSEDLGSFTKAKVIFRRKENVTLVFRSKRKVPFSASISKELDRLEQIGVLTKTDYRG